MGVINFKTILIFDFLENKGEISPKFENISQVFDNYLFLIP